MQEAMLHKIEIKKNKTSARWKYTLILLGLALLTKVMIIFAKVNPTLVENLYSSTIYPYIGSSLGFFNRFIPFSIAESIFVGILAFIIFGLILIIYKPQLILSNIEFILHNILRFIAIMYILFYFLWGFNYYREDYSVLANMTNEPATYYELKALTSETINKTNLARKNLDEDDNGVFYLDKNIDELDAIANLGFKDYQVGTLNLGGNYGKTKPVFLSKYMSYTGIIGIYIPFTSEPNVNMDVPNQSILSAISHEIAHQRGFAKEDEANFIAYKANINNSDERFQYSGYYLAMTNLMNEVYRQNRKDYSILYNNISDAVKRDLDYSREYWASKKGKVKEKANKINDNYLKANNQVEGVKSYNEVVQLLLGEYKERMINN